MTELILAGRRRTRNPHDAAAARDALDNAESRLADAERSVRAATRVAAELRVAVAFGVRPAVILRPWRAPVALNVVAFGCAALLALLTTVSSAGTALLTAGASAVCFVWSLFGPLTVLGAFVTTVSVRTRARSAAADAMAARRCAMYERRAAHEAINTLRREARRR